MNSLRLSINKWRFYISRTLWVASVSFLLVEIIICFILPLDSLNGQSPAPNLLNYLLIPSGLNFVGAAVNHYIQKSDKIDDTIKNYSIAICCALLAFVISFIHYFLVLTLALFVFPVFISVLFGDDKITRNITVLSAVLITLVVIHSTLLVQNAHFIIEIIIAYILLANSFYMANVLIHYIKQNNQCICDGYITQQVLLEKAKTDPLTGLYNHSVFMLTLEESIEQYHKGKIPFCVAMLDIDNFKSVNDTYGHLAGNLVLVELSRLLKELKETYSDEGIMLFRYGGEEFGLIFKNQTADMVFPKVDRIRQAFADLKHVSLGDRKITFSAGITEYQGDIILEDLFNTADAALYHAKDCGKNQTSIL